jgi:hypothetical protein
MKWKGIDKSRVSTSSLAPFSTNAAECGARTAAVQQQLQQQLLLLLHQPPPLEESSPSCSVPRTQQIFGFSNFPKPKNQTSLRTEKGL